MKKSLFLILVLTLGLFSSCLKTIDSTILVESIEITPESRTLRVGATVELAVNFTPSNATDKTITWKSSDPTVATVNSDGVVTAVKVGASRVTITATSGNGKTSVSYITVEATPVDRVTINGTIPAGFKVDSDPVELTATVTPSNATDKTVTWQVEPATGVVELTTTTAGVTVKPIGVGEATIIASAGGITDELDVKVEATLAESVTINWSGKQVGDTAPDPVLKGNTLQLSAEVLPANTTDKTVNWSSSNATVAAVNSATGEVTAIKAGTATITALNRASNKSNTVLITVEEIPATAVAIDEGDQSLERGATFEFTATPDPANTTDTAVWASSDESVATVDAATGEVTVAANAVAGATAEITVTYGGVTGVPVTVTVVVPATAVTINEGDQSIVEGGTVTFTATPDPTDTTDTAVWASSDESVATVDAATGEVTGVAAGEATITVTYYGDGEDTTTPAEETPSDSVIVTVTAA